MSDLMLMGILRAPPPEPDNFLGIAQLVSAAKTAADEIERLKEQNHYLTCIVRISQPASNSLRVRLVNGLTTTMAGTVVAVTNGNLPMMARKKTQPSFVCFVARH